MSVLMMVPLVASQDFQSSSKFIFKKFQKKKISKNFILLKVRPFMLCEIRTAAS